MVSDTAAPAVALLKFGILGALLPLSDSAGLLLNLYSPKRIASEVNPERRDEMGIQHGQPRREKWRENKRKVKEQREIER